MISKKKLQNILDELDKAYGRDYVCYLDHDSAWQLLVATILSAQCTDARVNIITKDLFKKYPTINDFALADYEELMVDIKSAGLVKAKAKNIIGSAQMIIEKHGGVVPSDIDELTKLPGVGRKTANVIRGNVYGIDSIVVDTHVARISKKLGLTENTDPVKIEKDLEKVLPKDHWILWNIQIITHGRGLCPAKNPHCGECFLNKLCKSAEM